MRLRYLLPELFTYKLNHIALSYDQTSGKLNGKVGIQKDVVLDPTGQK